MIGEFENTLVKTGYPIMNLTDLSLIRSIFLTRSDFTFGSETIFETKSNWIESIKDEDMICLSNLIEVEDNSENTEYNRSILDYEYERKPGKYIFTFKTVYKKEYHDHISSLSGQNLRVFIADINNNIAANLNGSDVRGLDVDLLNVEKKKFGSKDPSWTVIRLVLTDYSDFNLKTKMTWNTNRINLVHVTLTDITGAGNKVRFTIKDSVFDIPIQNLYFDDISIVDNEGGINAVLLTEKDCGEYEITASDNLTIGSILVNSDNYYGSAEYIITQTTVILNNYAWESQSKFEVDVRLSGDLSLYPGLVLADFTITDDIEGLATITNVTEVSTGRYEITVSETLTTGDIDIDDGTVTGSDEYEAQIEVEFYDWDTDTMFPSQYIIVSIREAITLNDVTGLTDANFTITDDNNGELGILSVTETASGTYKISLDNGRTSGDIEIVHALYFGTGNYSYSTVTVENAGGTGATDFLNPTDGLAERFQLTQDTINEAEITTGTIQLYWPDTAGNIQQVTQKVTTAMSLWVNTSYHKKNTAYKLRFKYSTLNAGIASDRFLKVKVQGANSLTELVNDTTIEPATIPETYLSDEFTVTTDESSLIIWFTIGKYNMSILVDEIELIEV